MQHAAYECDWLKSFPENLVASCQNLYGTTEEAKAELLVPKATAAFNDYTRLNPEC